MVGNFWIISYRGFKKKNILFGAPNNFENAIEKRARNALKNLEYLKLSFVNLQAGNGDICSV